MPELVETLKIKNEDTLFLMLISIIDTIHDWWNADRVKDPDDQTKEAYEKAAVIKFLRELGIDNNVITVLPNVIMSDIENSFTKYCSTKYDMSTIRDITAGDSNTLVLTDAIAQVPPGFSDKTDDYGCKSTRVIWSDSGILNTPEQYKDIGKLIFKYFGVNEGNGKLHLIIDSQAGRLTGASNSMVYDNDVATPGRTEIYNRMRVNINALNIADSASTRVGAGNIFHNYFPFTNKPAGEAVENEDYYKANNIGNYKLNNWSLTDRAMNDVGHYFIYAYYTNAQPVAVPAGANLWAELPFHNNDVSVADADDTGCYHISLKVCITTVKGDPSKLVNGTKWESSFIQGNNKNKGTKQGAGINKLANLIGQIDGSMNITSVGDSDKEFDLSPILNGFKKWLFTISSDQPMIKNILVAFIFDYKRSGDHEQVLSCKVMNEQNTSSNITYVLSTGDQLCALWARCQGVSCIWHHGNKMDMYSFAKDVWSKIRQTRFDTVTAVLAKYDIIKTALSAMAVPNIKEIIEMHKIGTPLYSKYMELESVKIYNKYLDDLLESIPELDNTLVRHYTDLITECKTIFEDISGNKSDFTDDQVEANPPNTSKLDTLKQSLNGKWIVPQDKYSSFIGEIIACPTRTVDEWKGIITPEYRKDMFGFTLEHHMKLFEKYYTLKQIHTAYNQKIFNSWHYGRDRDFPVESNPFRKPNARPNQDKDTIITDNAWVLYYRSTKANYDKFTKEFLVSDNKKLKFNTTGSALFDEIFGGTDEKIANTGIVNDICEMNSSFDPSFVKDAKPTWLVRTNCHNTGGLYYGISKISEWLGDIIAPKTLDLGNFENNRENNEYPITSTPILLFHPENLEPRKFYDKYKPGAAVAALPPSKWLIVEPGIPLSTSGTGGSKMSGGGPDDTLTYVSAPKFIDYIETIMSNIESDLDLNWVGYGVNKDDFKKYIIQTVKKLYLKYNQSDFNILYVYRLLKKLCGLNPDRKNVANIYRYIFLLYDKIYPEAVEHTPFNPLPFSLDEDFQKKWDIWNKDEMDKLKTEEKTNKEELMEYIPDNKAVFFEFITKKTIEAYNQPDLELNRETFRSVSVNTVNQLDVTINQLIHKEGKDNLTFLKEKLNEKNGSCLLPDATPMKHDADPAQTSSGPDAKEMEHDADPAKTPYYQQRPGIMPLGSSRRSGSRSSGSRRSGTPKKMNSTDSDNDQVVPDNELLVSNSRYSRNSSGSRNLKKRQGEEELYRISEENAGDRDGEDLFVPDNELVSNSRYSRNSSGSRNLKKLRTELNQKSVDTSSINNGDYPVPSESEHRMEGGKRKTYRKEKIHHSRKRRINNTRKMGNQRRINRKHTRRINRKQTRRINRKHTRRINRKQTRKHRNMR